MTPMPIAVVCAMDWELAHFRRLVDAHEEEWRDGRRIYRAPGLVLIESGMGMVSAAAGTQVVLSHYTPRAVLNYGCAGAHRADLRFGDIVVGERVIAYDNVRQQPDGALQYL